MLGLKYPSYFYTLGMGGGKTWLSLNLYRARVQTGKASRALVCVSNVVNLEEWRNQAKLHAKDCTLETIEMSGKENRTDAIFDSRSDIVVITYAGLARICSKPEQVEKGKKRRKWYLDPKACDQIAKAFSVFILDESTCVSNSQSLFYRVCRRIRKGVRYCYALTGTPFDKQPEPLWAQFFLVDGGYTLGETLGLWRAAFCSEKERFWGGVDHEFREKMMPVLAKRICHRSIRYSEEECQDLPRAVGGITDSEWMLIESKLSKEAFPYYESISDELKAAHGNYELIDNSYTRMRMLSSGWLGAKTEDGEKAEIIFPHNPKLDDVLAKMEELDPDKKFIIVHWFNVSGKLITQRLEERKHKFEWVYGKGSAKKKISALESFKRKSGPRILVASTAISKGVNLQEAARYMAFFESPDSLRERKQMEARVRREVQKLKGSRYFYDAVCKGTIDLKILRAMKEGKRYLDIIIDRKKAESKRGSL